MGTSLPPSEIKRFEVTEVYTHPDAKVDIILVHGLNGHPRNTWTAKSGTFWPTDLLPVTLKSAKARILVYGYNADVYAFGGDKSASSDMIHQHAQTMVQNLSLERKSEERAECPIIWVVHSLGGILLKRALELANDLTSKSSDDNRSIYVSTYGIIFLGTPHTGSDPAKWGHMLQSMCDAMIPKKVMDTEPHLVRTLLANNEVLQNINLHFLDIYQRFEISMVHEAVKTDLKGTRAFIVDQASASPQLPNVNYYGIEATHSGMCKFESKSSPGYLNVSTTIKSWVVAAPPVIESRWADEERYRAQLKEVQAKEILGLFSPRNSELSSISPNPISKSSDALKSSEMSTSLVHSVASIAPTTESPPVEPPFIKPPGFRPNSIFIGRKSELAQLHKLLFDPARRAQGTSAVLIQSLPGGGKTHLAREYIYAHLDDFPGGIFWVRAKSTEQMAAGFWDIARKLKLAPSEENLRDPQGFIRSVVAWLEATPGWLIVFDGIHFEHSSESDDMGVRRFMPDRPDTSVIYTSTDKGGAGDHHFMNPKTVRLPLLSAREARSLLLAELDKSDSASQDELVHAMELVQRMGFLPLAIHTVAKRLKATDEPLGRFLKSWKSEPRLRGVSALEAVVQELRREKAVEGLNLMRILCFWSQHVPVEMISLGLGNKGVDVKVETWDSEIGAGQGLNGTFRVLVRFALVEREVEDLLSNSQILPAVPSEKSSLGSASSHSGSGSARTRSSHDIVENNVDVIRIHSVIQDFCIDSVRANGDLPVWLARSVRLFIASFEAADTRIKKRSKGGLVEDYRAYEIHGERLLVHVRHLEKHGGRVEEKARLEEVLCKAKAEIEARTMSSSQEIASGEAGKSISIFDRTSSSSDAGPETPRFGQTVLWGRDGEHESPVSIKDHDHDLEAHGDIFDWRGRLPSADGQALKLPLRTRNDPDRLKFQPLLVPADDPYAPVPDVSSRAKFPPLPVPAEDKGYATDHEDLEPTRASTESPSAGWSVVHSRPHRTARSSPHGVPHRTGNAINAHRTIRDRASKRYRDSAGAWRSMGPADVYDARVENAHAHGFLDIEAPRAPSRGRLSGRPLSGQSMAEVALSTIAKESPPPARGGGAIHDRRPSKGRTGGRNGRSVSQRGRLGATATYAAAVAQGSSEAVDMQRARSDDTGRGGRPLLSPAERSLRTIPTLARPAGEGREVGGLGAQGGQSIQSGLDTQSGLGAQSGQSIQSDRGRFYMQPYPNSDASINRLTASHSRDNLKAHPQPYVQPYTYASAAHSQEQIPRPYAPYDIRASSQDTLPLHRQENTPLASSWTQEMRAASHDNLVQLPRYVGQNTFTQLNPVYAAPAPYPTTYYQPAVYARNDAPILVEKINYPPSRTRKRGLPPDFGTRNGPVPSLAGESLRRLGRQNAGAAAEFVAVTAPSNPANVQAYVPAPAFAPFVAADTQYRVRNPAVPEVFPGEMVGARTGMGMGVGMGMREEDDYALQGYNIHDGYTSLPMSRHISVQSDASSSRLQPLQASTLDLGGASQPITLAPADTRMPSLDPDVDFSMPDADAFDNGRRASLANTEPSPRISNLSPKAPLNSYALYRSQELPTRAGEWEGYGGGSNVGLGIQGGRVGSVESFTSSGLAVSCGTGAGIGVNSGTGVGSGLGRKKSPRLGFARRALIERMGPGGERAEFNPNARIFRPREAERDPNRPAYYSSPVSRIGEREEVGGRAASEVGAYSAWGDGEAALAPGMMRTASAGFKVPDGFIGFGDAEPVDLGEARGRAEGLKRRRRGLSSPESMGRRGYFE